MHEMEDKYEILETVGSGSFSKVHRARNRVTNEIVAVKIIPYKKLTHGVPYAVIREVSVLKELDHENIIRLLDVLPTGKRTALVFEYVNCSLHSFIRAHPSVPREPQYVKKILYQILNAVAYCHSQKILHRDIKPENVLVDRVNLKVKLSDFGLSRDVGVPRKKYTAKVATLNYMAPEVLFAYPLYSYPMDIWGVGCIFGEMIKGHKLFHSNQLIDQLNAIFSLLGTPNEETWPGVTEIYPYLDKVERHSPQDLANEFPDLEPEGVDLLSELLCLDPSKRITAQDALKHAYFSDL